MRLAYTNDFNETDVIEIPDSRHIQKNFTLKELANNKAPESVKFISTPRSRKFMSMIQEFRDWYGKPINVTSNYRTYNYNKTLKGASSNSLHLDALALDWKANHTNTQRATVRNKWKQICEKHGEIGGINYYTHGYHMCIGEEKFGNKVFTVRDYRGKRGDW